MELQNTHSQKKLAKFHEAGNYVNALRCGRHGRYQALFSVASRSSREMRDQQAASPVTLMPWDWLFFHADGAFHTFILLYILPPSSGSFCLSAERFLLTHGKTISNQIQSIIQIFCSHQIGLKLCSISQQASAQVSTKRSQPFCILYRCSGTCVQWNLCEPVWKTKEDQLRRQQLQVQAFRPPTLGK